MNSSFKSPPGLFLMPCFWVFFGKLKDCCYCPSCISDAKRHDMNKNCNIIIKTQIFLLNKRVDSGEMATEKFSIIADEMLGRICCMLIYFI